jgi:formyl-CoA transferase
MQGVYPRLSATPGSIRRGAPKLGEHNQEIYGTLLNLSAAEIENLRAEEVI